MDFERITEHWNDSGLVVIPGFLDRREISDLRGVCDHVLQQAIAEAPDRANASNIAFLTERWDLPEELDIRRGAHPNRPGMPGGGKIELGAGDACLFHAWGIHRGTYRVDIPRRTLDIIYGWGGACDYCPPPPLCFTDPDLRARLSPGARSFFEHFIKTYRSYWTGVSC